LTIEIFKPEIVKTLTIFPALILFSFICYSQQDFHLINSKHDELSPVLYPDGQELYFTRAYDSANVGGKKDKGDIYISRLEGNIWSPPRNAGKALNNRFYNAVVGFSPDGKIMFLHHRYPIDEKPPKTQGLSYSIRSGEKWTYPKPVEVKYFRNNSDYQSGSISADGQILLLAIDSYSSRGLEDIYVSFWDGSRFSAPKNLGSTINTKGQEMTPTLAPDNRTLFFSSNGHGGKGGRDLFKSERLDSTWTKWSDPVNISDINTDGVELSFIISPDMKWSVYTSTLNSDGYGDLNFYHLPQDSVFEIAEVDTASYELVNEKSEELAKPEKLFTGRVYNDKTRDFVDYSITVRSKEFSDSLTISSDDRVFKFYVPDSLQRLFVDVKGKGFMPITETILLDNTRTERIYYLKPLEVGLKINLDKIYFERGLANLIDSSYIQLDKVVEVMKDNPSMEIELTGHTDNQGDADKNLDLSQERVETVKDYLVKNGIGEDRITGKGYGGSRPIASNASEETRRLNRRVEFVITKF